MSATTKLIQECISRSTTVEMVDRQRCELDALSIEDFLKALIKDSDLIEVVCCLDMIANEEGKRLKMLQNAPQQIYPVIS